MIDTFLNIITIGLKPVYEKHLEYFKIIEEFRNKLPRPQNEAKSLTEEEKSKHPVLSDLKYINVLDLSTHKVTVSEADIDLFYNRLNNFDYRFMLFKDYYKKYTSNLNRFNPKAVNKDFNLVMVQLVLKDNSLKPIKPFDVLIFQLKWEVKLTSKIYIWFLKRTKKGAHRYH
jgi:hypothetical protein